MLIFNVNKSKMKSLKSFLNYVKQTKILYNIVVVLDCNILKYREVIYLRELFVEKVIDKTENFLDNNQRESIQHNNE